MNRADRASIGLSGTMPATQSGHRAAQSALKSLSRCSVAAVAVPFPISSSSFSAVDRPSRARGQRPAPQPSFGRPISDQTVPVEITLEEAFCGTKRTIQQGAARFEVTIPAGVKTGSKVRAGGLIMTVTVQPHKDFVMDGSDLHTKVPVDLYVALLGGEIHVETLQGTLALVIPADTQNGKVFRLKGQGMPDVRDNNKRGDLLVEVVVELPVPLSLEARRHFESLQRTSSD